jgi:2'-5' RNA ligase
LKQNSKKHWSEKNLRIFIAIKIPEEIKTKIEKNFSKKLDKEKFKIVKKENLHITLLFLGEKNKEETNTIIQKIQTIDHSEFEIKLSQTESFGKNTIWIKIKKGEKELKEIYKKISEVLGIKTEKFSPHVTIARNKKATYEEVKKIIQELNKQKFEEKFAAQEIHLMESKLNQTGPEYADLSSKTLSKRA